MTFFDVPVPPGALFDGIPEAATLHAIALFVQPSIQECCS